MAVNQAARPAWRVALARWCYYKSYFPQIGLRHDDTLRETEVVQEALRRLPEQQQMDRQFRIIRALDLSNRKVILPKDQWTKFEEDSHYLQPYIEEVKAELNEKAEWSAK